MELRSRRVRTRLSADEKHPVCFLASHVDDFVGNHSMHEITVELQKFFLGFKSAMVIMFFCFYLVFAKKTFELTYVILVVLVGG